MILHLLVVTCERALVKRRVLEWGEFGNFSERVLAMVAVGDENGSFRGGYIVLQPVWCMLRWANASQALQNALKKQ